MDTFMSLTFNHNVFSAKTLFGVDDFITITNDEAKKEKLLTCVLIPAYIVAK